MALPLTEEHLALADSVRSWAGRGSAGRAAPRETARAAVSAEDHGATLYRDTLRPGLASQGLLGLHLPEALGGQGYGLPELAVAAEELGRALLPGGYLPTVVASAVLAHAVAAPASTAGAGLIESLAKGLAAGSLTGAVGLAPGIQASSGDNAPYGDNAWSGDNARSGDSPPSGVGDSPGTGGGLVIDGTCGPVLGACLADVVVLPADDGQRRTWVAVDAADLEISPLDSLDLTRPAGRVTAHRVRVPAERVLAGLPPDLVTSLAATLFGAEACGIAGWAVDTAASYA